jgi:hypothetical protein
MCIMIMPDNVIGIEIALWIVFWVASLPGQARHPTWTTLYNAVTAGAGAGGAAVALTKRLHQQ